VGAQQTQEIIELRGCERRNFDGRGEYSRPISERHIRRLQADHRIDGRVAQVGRGVMMK